MTKEIESKIYREIYQRKSKQQSDYSKGFFWQTRHEHEEGLSSYLQGLLHAGLKEEDVNKIIDKANKDVNIFYGLKE
jgi:hypothetical protein